MTNREFIKVASDSALVELLTQSGRIVCDGCMCENNGECPAFSKTQVLCKYHSREEKANAWLNMQANLNEDGSSFVFKHLRLKKI